MNFLVYFAGNGVSKLFPFLLLPLLTSSMSVESYGIAMTVFAFYQVSVILVGFSSQSLVTMFYYDRSSFSRGRVLRYSFVILICNFIVWFLLSLFVSFIWFPDYLSIVALSMSGAFFYQIHLFNVGLFYIEQKAISFVIMSLMHGLGALGFTWLALKLCSDNIIWQSRVLGEICSVSILVIFAIVTISKKRMAFPLFPFSLRKLAYSYKKVFPLVLHSLSVFAIYYADRFILGMTATAFDIGIYAATFTLGQVVFLVVDSKSRVWIPYLAKHKDKIGNKKILWFAMIYLMSLAVFCVMYYALLSVVAEYFLPSEYSQSLTILPYVLIGFMMEAAYRESHVWLFLEKKTDIIALGTVLSGVIHLIFCWFLTLEFGVSGAAYAFVLSSTTKFFITFIFAAKNRMVSYESCV